MGVGETNLKPILPAVEAEDSSTSIPTENDTVETIQPETESQEETSLLIDPILPGKVMTSGVDVAGGQSRVWGKLPRGILTADIFRDSEQDGTGIATTLHMPILSIHKPYIDLNLNASAGLFNVFPDDGNFVDRNIFGFSGAVNLFIGNTLQYGPFVVRSAVEVGASLLIGYNLPITPDIPLLAGIFIGFKIDKTDLGLLAECNSYVIIGDGEGTESSLFLENASVGATLTSPSADVELGYRYKPYSQTGYIYGALTIPWSPSWAPGTFKLDLSAEYPIEAEKWVPTAGAFHISARFDFGKAKQLDTQTYGASLLAHFTESRNPIVHFAKPMFEVRTQKNDILEAGDIIECSLNRKMTRELQGGCRLDSGEALDCFFHNDTAICKTDKESAISYVAQDSSGSLTYMKPYMHEKTFNFTIKQSFSVDTHIDLLLNHETLDSLVSDYVSMEDGNSYYHKLSLLMQLLHIAHSSFSEGELIKQNSIERIDSATAEEMFQKSREAFFKPSAAKKLGQRAIAKYVAYVADRLGFEAHAVGINTPNGTRGIIVMRESGSDHSYSVLDPNIKDISKVSSRTLRDVIISHCKELNYPQQMILWTYSPDGSPNARFETALYKLIKEATMPRKQGHEYLRRGHK